MLRLKVWSNKVLLPILLMLGCGASQAYTLTIVNNYHAPLTFLVGQHPEIVASLATALAIVPSGGKIVTKVLDDQKQTNADIRVQDVTSSQNSAFFGVGVESNQVVVHGYIGSKIAFSWLNNPNATVVFCTPAEYKRHESCLF